MISTDILALILSAALQPPAGPAAPPIPPVAPAGQPASPLGDLGALVRPADYPLLASRQHRQGTTRFALTISPEGRVSNCTIVHTSGTRSLDVATCRIMTSRARFSPARDAQGTAVQSIYESTLTWTNPN